MTADSPDRQVDASHRGGQSRAADEPLDERGTIYSPRTRRAGGTLLLLTGSLGTLLGVGLLSYAALGGFAGVPPVTIALFALPTLLVGVGQMYGGWIAWRGRRWRVAMAIGVVGLLFSPNPVLVPVKLVALVLLAISEDQFP